MEGSAAGIACRSYLVLQGNNLIFTTSHAHPPNSLLRNTIRVDIRWMSTSCVGLKTGHYDRFSHSIG